jgi:hypothetical protein
MKKSISIACMLAVAGFASVASAQVRISQFYGGGGATTGSPAFNADYIELFNAGTSAVTLTGHALQYASATGTGNWTVHALPSITIAANSYFLVQVSEPAANTLGPALTVTPDLRPSTQTPAPTQLFMSATTGKIALTNNTTLLVGPNATAAVVDQVGYGPTANLSEGASPAPILSNILAGFRANNGCQDTNVNGSDFTANTPAPRNSATAANSCSGIVDCNNNGISDPVEIAGNPALDCNGNTLLDSCEINANNDCNSNGQLDSCEITGNALLDRDSNNQLDSCQIALFPDLDACGGANGILDAFETPSSAALDCNSNGVLDCWEVLTGQLTDVDANGTFDVCEGAIVIEAAVSAYLQSAAGTPARDGIVNQTNGSNFFTIQNPTSSATFNGYGVVRWNNSAFNGVNANRVYLQLTQRNAAFSAPLFSLPGDPNNMQVFHTQAQDATVITPGTTATPNNNLTVAGYETLFADRALINSFMFVRSSDPSPLIPDGGSSPGNGTPDVVKLYDAGQSNTTGGTNVQAELASNSGVLTLVVNHAPDAIGGVAGTWAGTASAYRGPTLVVFPGAGLPQCGSIDFNADGLFPDDQDLIDFLSVLAGGICSTEPLFTCGSIDFNGDGLFPDDNDLVDFLIVLAGGTPTNCTP